MSDKIICPFCGTENETNRPTCRNCQTNFRQAELFRNLAQRLARLETIVAELEQERPDKPPGPPPPEPLFEFAAAIPTPPEPVSLPPAEWPPTPQPSPRPPVAARTQAATPPLPTNPLRTYLPENIWRSDFWFNKIGLGLLFLALAFLFNYAIDQGWIGPAERLAVGLALGTFLLGIGYRTAQKQPHFGQAVQGGGIAAYYLTGFAAFRLYNLVTLPAAFGFMLLVTVLAFALSLRQKGAMLSLIGGLGGLATPLLLYTGQGNYVGLILYTCLICGSLVMIYFYQGWQVLLWLANIGGWGILLGVLWTGNLLNSVAASAETVALQGGILFGLLMFWGMPVLRRLDWLENPNRLPPVQFGIFDSALSRIGQLHFKEHPRLTILFNPLIAVWLTWQLWQLTAVAEGLITLGVAALFALVALGIGSRPGRYKVWYMHGVTAVLLLNIALVQLLDGSWLLLALAIEAAAFHVGTRYINSISLEIAAHLLASIVTVFLTARFLASVVVSSRYVPILNLDSLVDLAIIGLWFGIATFLQTKKKSPFQPAYWLVAHLAMLLWWYRELQFFARPGLVTLSWGFQAVVFHWDARRQRQDVLRWIPHLLSLVVVSLLFQQLLLGGPTASIFNLLPVFNLALIGLIFTSAYLFTDKDETAVSLTYRLVSHVALLAWFWQVLGQMGGQGVVTLVWGIYAIILLAISVANHHQMLRLVAISTLFLLVGKLFLVDLVTVDTVWRILLFAGFGGLFLFMSYFYRSWLHLPEHAD